jgi:hypothetical protein
MLDLFILSAVIVFIIDLSGIITAIEKGLSKWLKCQATIPKPFSCSLCCVWWVGLIYLICTTTFTIPMIGYVALLSFMTNPIYNTLLFIRDLLNSLIDKLYKALNIE